MFLGFSRADDYLTKPFMTKGLLARLRALSRRALPSVDGTLSFGDITQVGLGRLVLGEALVFEAVAYEKGLRLSCDAIDENISVYGNEERLRQLVSILLDNAMEHFIPGGEVCVTLARRHGRVCLSLANPGEEILKEQK